MPALQCNTLSINPTPPDSPIQPPQDYLSTRNIPQITIFDPKPASDAF
jgi:hypothetical protein